MITKIDEAVHEKRFDRRMLDKNLSRGVVSQEDVDRFVQGLKDDAENAEYVSLEQIENLDMKS